MTLLNNKQREILTYLDKVYPSHLSKQSLLEKIKDEPDAILSDIKILEQSQLVTLNYSLGDTFPSLLTITPKGKEKLQENFFRKFKESAYENPIALLALILSLISILANIVISNNAEQIQVNINQINEKIAEFDKINANNATFNRTLIPCFNGTKPLIELNDTGTLIYCK